MSVEITCPTCGEPIPADAPGGACPGCLVLLASDAEDDDALRGARLRPPALDKLQEFFPQYRLESLVGVGGQGVVYRAYEPAHNRQVALKVLTVEQAAHPEFLSRFALEAHTLARLSHPGIVSIYDSGQAGDYFFIAMQWVEGITLRDRLRGKSTEPRAAGQMISQVCDALECAHRQGIVHRDLKPENILIAANGALLIADFGIAKLQDETNPRELNLTATHFRLGTARYMAPEQMRGERTIDARADIYALGVILFELLTGELPLPFGLPASKIAGIPPVYDRIVARCMRPLPVDRFASVVDLRRQLHAAAKSWPPKVRRAVTVAATLVACAALLFTGFLWGRYGNSAVAPPPPEGIAATLASPEWEWTEPENLGPLVNTSGNDHAPFLSADGLTLLYHGRGHEARDNADIWQCRRSTVDAAWSAPENLGPVINTEHWEGDPCLSADGLTLFFAAEWRDSMGLVAIVKSSREQVDAAWSEPELLQLKQTDSTDKDRGPVLSADGLTLWFARGAAANQGFDLMVSRRNSLLDSFQQAAAMGAPINSSSIESDPAVSSDGLVLMWTAPFSPGAYDQEVWWSFRVDPTAPWQAPRRLSDVISSKGAAEPCLSADGSELYFASARVMDSRDGKIVHHGGTDLYVSRRVRKSGRQPMTGAAFIPAAGAAPTAGN